MERKSNVDALSFLCYASFIIDEECSGLPGRKGARIIVQKNVLPYHLLGGVISIVLALRALSEVDIDFLLDSIPELIRFVGFAALGLSCIWGKRTSVQVAGVSILAAAKLFVLFDTFTAAEVLAFIAYLLAAFIAVECFTDYLPQYRSAVRDIWFVPTACMGGAFFVELLKVFLKMVTSSFARNTQLPLSAFLETVLLLFVSMWMLFPEGLPKEQKSLDAERKELPDQEAYCNLVQHILLLLFTCGIWFLVWIYKTTAYLNRTDGEESRRPVAKLLLCVFVPFYYIYWLYESARRMDRLTDEAQEHILIPCLVFSIFAPILPPVLLQQRINAQASLRLERGVPENTDKVYLPKTMDDLEEEPTDNETPDISQQTGNQADRYAELREYKSLLDEGLITQEDYDTRKRTLLELK